MSDKLHPHITLMRPFLYRLLALALLLTLTQCEDNTEEAYRFHFQFITEDYKPLNYLEGTSVKGLAPDLLKEICARLDIPYEVKVLPWTEGYNLAQTADNAVLFSVILDANRKDLFKWAGPIASLDWYFYAQPQSPISLNSLDDAKSVGRIGVLEDYSMEQYLVGEGFTNLVYCTDNIDAFDKLIKGEIDLFPSDQITAEAALKTLGKTLYHVTPKSVIKTDLVYFAFNKHIPDNVVADFQQAIDQLKSNGTLRILTQKYLNTQDAPGVLQIYTEDYPPLTFRNNMGDITGFGSDIVYEIMKRNQVYANIRLTSWSNGYQLALTHPNVCLFTMDRTELREDLFQWVGPIGTNTTWIYTRAGSGITITSLEEARSLTSLGTVSSWFSDQYLRNLGFTNLVSDSDPRVMALKLVNGEIDGFVCTSVTFPSILQEVSHQYSEVVPSFSLMASDFYIAFSNETPASTVQQWQTALDAMKLDETYDAIYQKWLP